MEMETNGSTKIGITQGWGLVIWWVIATTLAFQAGYIIGQWLFIGLFVGIAQGSILFIWRVKIRALFWIVASSIGWAIGLVTVLGIGLTISNLGIGSYSGSISGLLISVVVIGPMLGLTQWLVLRGWVRGAFWWILGTTLGYAFGLIFALFSVATTLGLYSPYLAGATGILFGTITGITLKVLLTPIRTRANIGYATLIFATALFIVASPAYINVSRNPFRLEPNIQDLPIYPGAQQVEILETRSASFAPTTQRIKMFQTSDNPDAIRAFYDRTLSDQGFVLYSESPDELEFT